MHLKRSDSRRHIILSTTDSTAGTMLIEYSDCVASYLYEPASDSFVAFMYRTPGGTTEYFDSLL